MSMFSDIGSILRGVATTASQSPPVDPGKFVSQLEDAIHGRHDSPDNQCTVLKNAGSLVGEVSDDWCGTKPHPWPFPLPTPGPIVGPSINPEALR